MKDLHLAQRIARWTFQILSPDLVVRSVYSSSYIRLPRVNVTLTHIGMVLLPRGFFESLSFVDLTHRGNNVTLVHSDGFLQSNITEGSDNENVLIKAVYNAVSGEGSDVNAA